MEILKRFQASRHVRLLQSGARVADAQLVEARAQLEAMGAPAIRAIFEALATVPATPVTLDVLQSLVNQDTLPAFIEGLRTGGSHVVDAAALVLSRAPTYDATQLLALYSDDRLSRARLEAILEAQAANLHPAALLRLLPNLGKEARSSAFRLLERIADASILAEALELTKHPEWWIRLHVIRLLARVPGPAANAAITKVVRDENGAVRLEAVRAVAKLQVREAIPALCTRLRDPDLKVQTAAIEALVGL